MLKRFYRWLYRATARPDERGEYSGGRWEGLARSKALELCKGVGGKVLEIGFGSGLFLLKLAAQEPAVEAWGVDNNGLLLDRVKAKAAEKSLSNVMPVVEDARRLSFADETFDRVVCVNLFLNIGFDAMVEVLKEMKRVCKRSGRLIFEFRNSRNLFFVLKYKLARFYDETAPYPLHTFDPLKVDRLMAELGLKEAGKSFIGFPVKRYAPIIVVEADRI